MAKTDPEDREQLLTDAEALLLAKYAGGRDWIDPVRVMHAVRAAADRYGLDDQEQAEVPADDVLAALTQLDEARAALDTLERDLTRAARRRGASWQQVADHLGLASRSSAESRFVRLERDAATYRGDRYPERQRAERARDRAGDAWSRANEPHLRAAVWSLACLNDGWERLARTASAERLTSWHRELDGPALAARLKTLRRILDPVDGDLPADGTPAAAARTEVLALLDELLAARHGTDAPAEEWTH
jgi:type II secretory pathway component PulJ